MSMTLTLHVTGVPTVQSVMVFDPGKVTGLAILDLETGDPVAYGVAEWVATLEDADKLANLMAINGVSRVVIERYTGGTNYDRLVLRTIDIIKIAVLKEKATLFEVQPSDRMAGLPKAKTILTPGHPFKDHALDALAQGFVHIRRYRGELNGLGKRSE